MTIAVEALEDARLAPYRALTDPAALRARGAFVAEGRLVVERLIGARGFEIESLLLTPAAAGAMAAVVAQVPDDVPVYVAPQAVLNHVVGLNIHRGCLALARRPPVRALVDLPLASLRGVVVAEGVNDPDNVGSLFRNAAALGAEAVVIGPGCANPLYRKAIRTSMGAALLLPWADAGRWPDALATLRHAGLAVVACTPDADATPLGDVSWPSRVAVLVGAERSGLTPEALACADVRLRIPMHGGVDSINVATAAAVALAALDASRDGDRKITD